MHDFSIVILGDIFPPNFDGTNPVNKGDYWYKMAMPTGYHVLLSLVYFDSINATKPDQALWIVTDNTQELFNHIKEMRLPVFYKTKNLKVTYSFKNM